MTEHSGPDTVEVGHDSRFRAVPALAAVALAGLLLAGAVAALRTTAHHDSSATPARAPASAPARPAPVVHRAAKIVPWRDLEPGHPVYRRDSADARVTPYDDVSATGTITGSLRRGDTLVFDAVLVSPGLVSLHPCPDYTITFGTHRVTRRLNCAEVPYYASLVRPDGQVTGFRPVLPAGTAVAFRMALVVHDSPGEHRVRWALDGPRHRPAFSGTVRVG